MNGSSMDDGIFLPGHPLARSFKLYKIPCWMFGILIHAHLQTGSHILYLPGLSFKALHYASVHRDVWLLLYDFPGVADEFPQAAVPMARGTGGNAGAIRFRVADDQD